VVVAALLCCGLVTASPSRAAQAQAPPNATAQPDAPTPEMIALERKSAEAGDPFMQYMLGGAYDFGRGVTQDYAEAAKWYRKSADQGYAPAQFNLSALYVYGQGVPQDYVSAHMWLNLATAHSSGDQQKQYAEFRDALAAKMTAQQIAEAQLLARKWQVEFDKRKK